MEVDVLAPAHLTLAGGLALGLVPWVTLAMGRKRLVEPMTFAGLAVTRASAHFSAVVVVGLVAHGLSTAGVQVVLVLRAVRVAVLVARLATVDATRVVHEILDARQHGAE